MAIVGRTIVVVVEVVAEYTLVASKVATIERLGDTWRVEIGECSFEVMVIQRASLKF